MVVAFVKVGLNLRLEKKFLEMHYEMQMRSWTTDPEESDDDLETTARRQPAATKAALPPPGRPTSDPVSRARARGWPAGGAY